MSVGEDDHCRAVPRFHDAAVVLVEIFDVLRHRLVAVPCRGHHHSRGVGYGSAAHVHRFEGVVERRRVRRFIRLADRQDVRDVVAEEV